jgi:hypothetical protein
MFLILLPGKQVPIHHFHQRLFEREKTMGFYDKTFVLIAYISLVDENDSFSVMEAVTPNNFNI